MTQGILGRFKLTRKLPSFVPDLLRFAALRDPDSPEVELRVLRKVAVNEVQAQCLGAFYDLRHLDHPFFPPVLEHGEFTDCLYYLVPLRDHPTLDQLIPAPELPNPARLELLRFLAGALAAAHERGIVLGSLAPTMVVVDPELGLPCVLGHGRPVSALGLPEIAVPPELRAPAAASRRGDLFSFGLLAASLMARHPEPVELNPSPGMPFRYREPTGPPELAAAVARCLSWKATEPAYQAADLLAAMGSAVAGPLKVGDDEGSDLSVSMKKFVQRRRREGERTVATPLEPSSLSDVEAGLVSGLGAHAGWPRSSHPGRTSWPRLGLAMLLGFGAGRALDRTPTAPDPGAVTPALAAAVAPAAPAPARPTPAAPLVGVARYQADPRFPYLLSGATRDSQTFNARVKLLRHMNREGALPTGLVTDAGLTALKDLSRQDLERARTDLDGLLRELSKAVDYASWRKD